jgi:hypothetical protein
MFLCAAAMTRSARPHFAKARKIDDELDGGHVRTAAAERVNQQMFWTT